MRVIGIVLAAMVLASCAAPGTGSSHQSPVAAVTPSASSSPSSNPSAAPSPTQPAADLRLVIADYVQNQVRLARLDATDTATVKGNFIAVVADQVIVLNGTSLEALGRNGVVRKLGDLAAPAYSIAIKPDLTQWIYAVTDTSQTSTIHLGTPTSDVVYVKVPSPDGNASYQGFAWTASGVYMVRQPTGLGGAGPFLEYHFQLATLAFRTARVTDVSPACTVYQVFDDGTMLCRPAFPSGQIEVRSPSGASRLIQLATANGAGTESAFWKVVVSPDHQSIIASRNGAQDPVIDYQMAISALSGSGATAFGPVDYVPDAWLPDGRVVADHLCVPSEWGGGPCSTSLDGTYFFSADGKTRTLFYKLKSGAVVGYV